MTTHDIMAAQARAIEQGLNPATLAPFSKGWVRPSPDDVRLVLQLAGFTESQAGQYVGVDPRNIRKWKAGAPAPTYGGWCLLVYAAGLGMIPDNTAFDTVKI